VNAWRHEPRVAAEAAIAFATQAFVEDDIAAAFAQLPSERQEKNSVEEMAYAINAMHLDGRPTSIKATEYQPPPGYHGMNVFLEGRSDARTYYYRFLMEGDASDGYFVRGIERAPGPFPDADQRRSLQ